MQVNIREQDNHCHLLSIYYGSIDNILNILISLRKETTLEYVVNMGLDYISNVEILNISNEYYDQINPNNRNNKKFLRIGLGLHPEKIVKLGKSSILEFQKITKLIFDKSDQIDYIGEVGLDFHYSSDSFIKDLQMQIFKDFCDLAIELKKPLSIHSRKAMQATIKILRNKKFIPSYFNGYLHCFTGNFEEGVELISMGFKLGVNGIITYDYNKSLQHDILQIINHFKTYDINQVIGLETDSPYLSPNPYKNTINSPKNIKLIKDYLIKLIEKNEISNQL